MHQVLIALGGNLPSPFGAPQATCEAALSELEASGVRVLKRSSWYITAPVPASDQPWFTNGVVLAETNLEPEALMALLHRLEDAFGRVREAKNGPRTLDLDLLAHGNTVRDRENPVLPHPRLHERAFVLVPLTEIAPDWRHPTLNRSARDLLAALPGDSVVGKHP